MNDNILYHALARHRAPRPDPPPRELSLAGDFSRMRSGAACGVGRTNGASMGPCVGGRLRDRAALHCVREYQPGSPAAGRRYRSRKAVVAIAGTRLWMHSAARRAGDRGRGVLRQHVLAEARVRSAGGIQAGAPGGARARRKRKRRKGSGLRLSSTSRDLALR